MITKPLIQSAGMLEGQSRQYKEPAKIASVGVTIQAVLRWPIFGGSYDADSILAPIFEDDDPDDDEDGDNVKDNLNSHKSKSDRGGNTISEENQLLNCDLKHLIGRFLTNVQTKNPILDQNILEAYTNEIRANGFDESGKTCIVVSILQVYI